MVPVKHFLSVHPSRAMTIKPPPPGNVHFPTTSERGPFPFPTSKSIGARKAAPDVKSEAEAEAEAEPSAEELRLMADTMPGDGPGD
jgi:hypothetical protein